MIVLVAQSNRNKSNKDKKRAVKCVETGKIFASSADAADILSEEGRLICPRNILSVCQGKKKSAGGFRWEYA